jgi:hypothetical protein
MSNNYNQTLQSNNIDLQAILDAVNELPEAGGSEPILQDKTVTPTTSVQKVTADSAYDGLNEVTINAMPTATQATPSITVSTSGLITASSTQEEGYVTGDTKSATKQLTTQAAKTITPSTSSQTAVAKNVYTTGAVTVAAIPSNYEDVGTETNAYTNKLASLNTAITALETELQGKASGGSGGGNIDTCTVTLTNASDTAWFRRVIYESLENCLITGIVADWATPPMSSIDIVALQGSVITIIDYMNIGANSDYGMNNCTVSNDGTLVHSIQDAANIVNCGLVIQLPNENACTITVS